MNLPPAKIADPAIRARILLVIIYIGFVSLGLPDTVLGVAWDYMRVDFGEPIYYAGFLTMLLTLCSAVSSFMSGAVLRRVGTGRLLMICGYLTGFSLLGYALSPVFWGLLLLTVPLGFGQGAVDTGMNFYVAKHYSSRDMSWLHCCWGIGASAGPTVVTLVIAAGWSWRWSYGLIASVQIVLATLFLAALGLWRESGGTAAGTVEGLAAAGETVTRDVRFWCCTLIFWAYTGIEVSIGLWSYTLLTTLRQVPAEAAGYWVAGYWGALTAGRFLLGIFADRIGNRRLIRCSTAGAMLAGILLAVPGGRWLALAALLLAGFSLASLYPCMMHEAPRRFNDATAGILTGYQGGAGALGIAMIPPLVGYIAARTTFGILPYVVFGLSLAIFLMQVRVDGWRLARR